MGVFRTRWTDIGLGRNREQIETWNRAIPRADRKLTEKDWVCSEHFHEDDIIRFFEDIKVEDLVIKGEKRSKPILKDGAVPSIFNGPAYLNKLNKKRKAPRDRSEEQGKNNKKAKINQDLPPPSPENENNTDYKNVKLPWSDSKNQWVIQSLPGQISYLKINEKGTVTHLLKIDLKTKDFTVEVRQCIYPQKGSVENAEEIASLLVAVDSLKLCEGNGYFGFSKRCCGGIRKRIRCKACRESRKSAQRKEKRELKLKRLRTQRNKSLKKSLQDKYLKMGCKRYGKPRISSKGIRPNQKSLKTSCPVYVYAKQYEGCVVISSLHLEHNHVLDSAKV
ncbi:THAP domain-containing protein 1 [Frankliniella fusca]|uniref:THAP domain-containing protein 1 n=1 Tax=Frankliniella fusca TaxID=407009 RepID=A0AAE1LPC1_9NEOP|nr:THAP domain-containing protein 1 [Frankliniella fusca]